MAEDEDVALARSGEKDLTFRDFRRADLSGVSFRGCDLHGSDLTGAKLIGCDFRQARLDGCMFVSVDATGANFSGVDLSNSTMGDFNLTDAILINATIRGRNLRTVNFKGANLRGTNFAGSAVDESNNLFEAIVNDDTSFDGLVIRRALARHTMFLDYDFLDGHLAKKDKEPLGANDRPPIDSARASESVDAIPRIERRLASAPGEIGSMALALSVAAEEHLILLAARKPNELEELVRYESTVALIGELSSGLRQIAEHLRPFVEPPAEDSSPPGSEPLMLGSAAKIAAELQGKIASWWGDKGDVLVKGSLSVGYIGAATLFLTSCGAPALGAFGLVSAMWGYASYKSKGSPASDM